MKNCPFPGSEESFRSFFFGEGFRLSPIQNGLHHIGALACQANGVDVPPIRHAFEKARVANMTLDELDLYDKAGIAITDARGRIELAREEGMQQGEQQGRLKGRLEGQAELFLELIGERFGPVPDWVGAKLAQADPETLKGWSRKMFRAATLEEIFQ